MLRIGIIDDEIDDLDGVLRNLVTLSRSGNRNTTAD